MNTIHKSVPGGLLSLAVAASLGCGAASELQGASEGQACGDCGAGAILDGRCVYPSIEGVDLERGLSAADVGDRSVYDPEDYEGSDQQRVVQALAGAQETNGAVVMGRVYELDQTLYITASVMITGGGFRRACTPLLTLTQAAEATDDCIQVDTSADLSAGTILLAIRGPRYSDYVGELGVASTTAGAICAPVPIGADLPTGTTLVRQSTLVHVANESDEVLIDSVLLDGANRCNGFTHDWRYNNAVSLRSNTLRNSVVFDSPSESITTCGATIENNRGFDLQGSFIHKSCSVAPEPTDRISDNYIDGTNLAGDDVMYHSEGLITLSANAGTIESTGNIYRNGREGVFGLASIEDQGLVARNDCYAHFSQVVGLLGDTPTDGFDFDAELIDVPIVFKRY